MKITVEFVGDYDARPGDDVYLCVGTVNNKRDGRTQHPFACTVSAGKGDYLSASRKAEKFALQMFTGTGVEHHEAVVHTHKRIGTVKEVQS